VSERDSITNELLALRERAYAPYSGYHVAAVVESDTGRRFGGCNVEVAHFKSVCAEASAISAMIGAGERTIRAVYLLGPDGAHAPPCGDCRQRIREFAAPECRILLLDRAGNVLAEYSQEALLPAGFGPLDTGA